jgi:hypothetical protein
MGIGKFLKVEGTLDPRLRGDDGKGEKGSSRGVNVLRSSAIPDVTSIDTPAAVIGRTGDASLRAAPAVLRAGDAALDPSTILRTVPLPVPGRN